MISPARGSALPIRGGDWYHAQTLPDGRVLLAVGDMAGHGVEAAIGMALLRFSLIGWLAVGIRDPGLLLSHLNQLCAQLGITGTALVGVYDPSTRLLSWARAGHMAPLLGRDGRSIDIEQPPGLLLGAETAITFPVATVGLCPGDLLLFYTDGLVERRGNVARRTAEVREHLCTVSAELGVDALPRIHRLLHAPSPDDDTCTLTVRVRD